MREIESARQATTPGLVGSAIERPVLSRLKALLPSGMAVGSGCVIDSKGNTSRQMDVVLYEKDICPRFSINDTPETTYYPCEGVIAVGEVKSRLDKSKIEDAVSKIASAKALQRNFDEPRNPAFEGRKVYDSRRYGQTQRPAIGDLNYNPYNDPFSESFGFILADRMDIRSHTLHEHLVRVLEAMDDKLCPNVLVVLTGEIYQPSILRRGTQPATLSSETVLSIKTANSLIRLNLACPFGRLVRLLYHVYRNGKTACLEVFDQYLRAAEPHEVIEDSVLIRGRPIQGPAPKVTGLL